MKSGVPKEILEFIDEELKKVQGELSDKIQQS